MNNKQPGMESPATPAQPVRIWRDAFGECHANVRHVPHHSPDGFEVGYGGSGPADLALAILNTFVPPGADGQPSERCYRGRCSKFAMRHHQDFKVEFIARMPRAGGEIPAATILEWIEQRKAVQP